MNQDHPLSKQLDAAVAAFIGSDANTLANAGQDPAFDPPLLGFARGDDPIFEDYKDHVGPFHWTPLEAFRLQYPELPATPAELTVVSWVLPQTARTRKGNGAQDFYPAEAWARARIFGELVNEELRRRVVDFFGKRGIAALAPALHPEWSRMDSDRFVWASKWSERHMAYAAGLGTFGLCDGLITPKGKAMRVGSVVARTADLPITVRPYTDHHAYCLYFATGKCMKCAERCPVGAISAAGHDKRACRRHVHETCRDHVRDQYELKGYACGLCQTGVPCEWRIPLPEYR